MKRLLGLTLAATFAFYAAGPAKANDAFDFFCADVSCLIAAMNGGQCERR